MSVQWSEFYVDSILVNVFIQSQANLIEKKYFRCFPKTASLFENLVNKIFRVSDWESTNKYSSISSISSRFVVLSSGWIND